MGRRIRYRPTLSEEQIAELGRAQEDTFWRPNIIITIAVVWVLVLVVIVGVGFLLMQNRKFQHEFAPLVDVCRGKWVSGASSYSSTSAKHPAVAVRNSSAGWQLDGYLIPGEVSAQSLAETEMVLCMGTVQEIFIERCPYVSESDSRVTLVVERYYYKQEARLLEAKTGRVTTIQTFTGKSPRYCEKSEWFVGGEKTKKLVGSDISDSDVRSWVLSHLLAE